jgi:outer membrane protein TolC
LNPFSVSTRIFLALLLTAQSLYAAEPLTLDEAIRTAVETHPQVIEAKETLVGAEARTGLAFANYYPQVSFSADWIRGETFFPAQEVSKLVEINMVGLFLKQNIYDFGRTAGAVDAARSNRQAAEESLTVMRQGMMLRVRSAFYLLLASEKQVVAVRENVKARDEIFRQAQEFFNQGIKAKVDVAKAEAALFSAKTSLIKAENMRGIARVELANAMGMASLEDRPLVEPSALLLPMPELSSCQKNAERDRAELQQFSALKSAAVGNLKSAKSSYLPVLSGTANIGYADQDFLPTENAWGVGLNMTVPLFSGFSSVEQVREATASINAIEARQNNLKLQISKEVESAWLDGIEAVDRMVSTEKEVAAADENKLLAEGRYQEGVGSMIEVTDAQAQALDAQTANIRAKFDYYLALARLDRAVGKP